MLEDLRSSRSFLGFWIQHPLNQFNRRLIALQVGRLLIAALVSFRIRFVGGLLFGFEDLLELFNYIFCMWNVLVFGPIGNAVCVFFF